MPITVDADSEAPDQRVLTLELQVGRRALERLLQDVMDGLLGILVETVVMHAVSAGRDGMKRAII